MNRLGLVSLGGATLSRLPTTWGLTWTSQAAVRVAGRFLLVGDGLGSSKLVKPPLPAGLGRDGLEGNAALTSRLLNNLITSSTPRSDES